MGLIKMHDVERNTEQWVDTSSSAVRATYARWWRERQEQAVEICRKNGVDLASIATDDDYVVKLMTLFKQRG